MSDKPKMKNLRSRKDVRGRMKSTGIDPRKMNEAGYYEGMPGVRVDDYGNRKFILFVLQPDAIGRARLMGPPELTKKVIENTITHDPLTRGIVYGAVIDHMFKNKTIWNWLTRTRYKLLRKATIKRRQKKFTPEQIKQAATDKVLKKV